MFMPPPWFFMNGPQDHGHNHAPDPTVPARVVKALEFVGMISPQLMPRLAMNDVSMRDIDPRKLLPSEEVAYNAACDLLELYFTGKLAPNMWEATRLAGWQQHLSFQARAQMVHSEAGRVTACFACQPDGAPPCPPNPTCAMCGGSGRIVVFGWGPTYREQAAQAAAEQAAVEEIARQAQEKIKEEAKSEDEFTGDIFPPEPGPPGGI